MTNNSHDSTLAQVMRLKDVSRRTNLSPPTITRAVQRHEFPAPRRLSPRRIGWLTFEIDQWIASRPVVAT